MDNKLKYNFDKTDYQMKQQDFFLQRIEAMTSSRGNMPIKHARNYSYAQEPVRLPEIQSGPLNNSIVDYGNSNSVRKKSIHEVKLPTPVRKQPTPEVREKSIKADLKREESVKDRFVIKSTVE